jgi:hypothetical protein
MRKKRCDARDRDTIGRINVEVPKDIITWLKYMSIKYNCTRTQYIIRCLYERMRLEDDYDRKDNV